LSTVNYQFLTPFGAPVATLSWSAVSNSPNRYLREGKEYIDDFWWNKYDYGWRAFCSLTGRSLQRDPLASEYPWISSYALWINNPLRFIDPDGRDIWEMDYLGRIIWIEESEEHTMYALDKSGARTGQSVTIKDRSIFDNLAATGKNSNYKASFTYGNPSELASVFLFGADNSGVEWRFSRFDVGNGDQYAIGTAHDPGNGVTQRAIRPDEMGFSRESEIASIHSHPGISPNIRQEEMSMGFERVGGNRAALWAPSDWANVRKDVDNNGRQTRLYYVYFPNSTHLYHVEYQGPIFIRKINSSKRLFFGTL
jgi:RHS repeat-associated protein